MKLSTSMKSLFWPLLLALTFIACNSNNPDSETKQKGSANTPFIPKSPAFNQDSAYSWIEQQVALGPRVPGTKSHAQGAELIEKTLKRFGLQTIVQSAPITTYDGKIFTLKNIIASYKPDFQKRILLLAHWDSRHIADSDTAKKNIPIDGADDGASGVGVLLEIARQITNSDLNLGVDFFFTDLEDYGQPNESNLPKMEDSWCLGTQYWAKNPHIPGYTANYGILLDMVGAKGAVFPKEGTGVYFAPDVVDKVWKIAAKLGYNNYFVDERTGSTTDDHLYVNTLINIPCIDIVHMKPTTGSYGQHHHTHQDNLSIIDKNILKVVGQTVMETLYQE